MHIVFIILLALAFCIPYPARAQVSHPAFRYVGNDSVVTCASDRYKAHSFLRYVFMGKNYREEWEQPVVLPVFRLSQTKFTIEELGGGMQTKTLKLEDPAGKQWVLRTIDKDVAAALPKPLRNTLAQKVAQDQISASMPYGVLMIGSLAKSAGILAPEPTVYFVADDKALGEFRNIFANTVCMLEERDPGFKSTVNTETVLRRVMDSSHTVIDQKALLKARLFDMLLADWDRHYDNWRWGLRDSAGLQVYRAIPRDRDWAFYRSGGFVPKLARLVVLRFLINFQESPRYIKSLSRKANVFDAVFLNSTTTADWREAIHQLQQSLDDKAIEAAVQKLPASVLAMEGEFFRQVLKSRRDKLEEPVMQYYRFLTRDMQVEGSNEDDIFALQPAAGGFVLQIFRIKANGERQKTYERHILRSETFRVTLNGLGGADRFELDEGLATTIRLKINGGTGKDSYDLRGGIRVEVHDDNSDNDLVVNKNSAKINLR